MSNSVLKLSDPEACDGAVAGGKAASLARMTLAGFSVPRGFVVTTAVYTNSISEIAGQIRSMLAELSSEDFQAITQVSETVRKLLEDIVIPATITEELRNAHVDLHASSVSARSSGTDEDQAKVSFAGQYETYLNILTFDQLIERIRRVWSSAYSPQAIAYRLRNRLPHGDVQMAVVVQEQLAPDAAGVMFTMSPVTRSSDFVVNAGFGLGEGVVAGTVETDHFTLDPNTGTVISSHIVPKSTMIGATPGGGVGHVHVPQERAILPALSLAQLADLAGQGRRLVDLFGAPQDVEFAVVEGETFLLQSRPITGIENERPIDWEAAVDSNYHWQLDTMSTHGGPVYGLQQDLVESYARGTRQCFDLTGAQWSQRCVVEFVHGYPYLRALDVPEQIATERRQAHTSFCEEFYGRGTSNYRENAKPTTERILGDLWRLRHSGSDLRARVEYLEGAVKAYGFVMGHLHWCISGFDERPEWGEIYQELTGEPAQDAFVFVQALPNRTTRLISRLRGLARMVQGDPVLSTIFAEGRYDDLTSPQLRQRSSIVKFRKRFNSLMRTYGFRTGWSYGSYSGFETPTWNLDPDRPLGIIASYAEQDLDEMDRYDADALTERVNATRRVRRKLSGDPDGLATFNAELRRVQGYLHMMEDHNHLMEQCTVGHVQDAIHMTGAALVRFGILDVPKDVFHISLKEIRHIVDDEAVADLRSVVSERRFVRESRKRLAPPAALGAATPAGQETPVVDGESADHDVIRGTAASSGRAMGPARLVTANTPVDRWRRGDVMVAVNVGQDWTPVFPLLGALVLDQGAVFQHAALIAREYRIPAVVMARDATQRIADGRMVTVDGDAGVVYLE